MTPLFHSRNPEGFRESVSPSDSPFPRSGGFAGAKEKGDKGGCFSSRRLSAAADRWGDSLRLKSAELKKNPTK